jgi:Spy/CpxP family protein refolding chaperone
LKTGSWIFGGPLAAAKVRDAGRASHTKRKRGTKHVNSNVARTLVLALSSTLMVAAQGHRGPGGDAVQNTADAIARRVSFLTTLLTLTQAQAAQATTIFTNAAAAVAPLQTNLSTARTSLRAAVQANNTTQIDQLATQIGSFTAQITAAESKADAAFYALLTAEQRTRYDAVGGGRGGRR